MRAASVRTPGSPRLVLAAGAAGAALAAGACGGESFTTPQARLASAPAERTAVRIARVTDGDTIKVRLADGRRRTVRLIGIDTPETVRPGTPVECGGPDASRAMRGLALERRRGRLVGRAATLVSDPSQDAIDRYRRMLAYVEVAGRDLGMAMVEAGWSDAYVYSKPFARLAGYRRAAGRAKAAGRGVWGLCSGYFHRPG